MIIWKGKGQDRLSDAIPRALTNLLDAARRAQSLPVLTGLAERCREIVFEHSAEEST